MTVKDWSYKIRQRISQGNGDGEWGECWSEYDTITLRIESCCDVTVNTQATNQTKCAGSSASLSVTATSSDGSLYYQWQKNNGGSWNNLSNGGDISGVTTSTLTISNLDASDDDDYRCVLTNDCGDNVTSNPASITVNVTIVEPNGKLPAGIDKFVVDPISIPLVVQLKFVIDLSSEDAEPSRLIF